MCTANDEPQIIRENKMYKFKVGDRVRHRTWTVPACPAAKPEPVIWKKIMKVKRVYTDRYSGKPVYVCNGNREYDEFELIEAENK